MHNIDTFWRIKKMLFIINYMTKLFVFRICFWRCCPTLVNLLAVFCTPLKQGISWWLVQQDFTVPHYIWSIYLVTTILTNTFVDVQHFHFKQNWKSPNQAVKNIRIMYCKFLGNRKLLKRNEDKLNLCLIKVILVVW